MEVIISGRKIPVSDDLREYIRGKLARIEREYTKLTTARVVLDSERGQYIAEIGLRGKHLDLEVKTRAADMYAALDDAAEKLEHRLRKHVERLHDHRNQPTAAVFAPATESETEEDTDIEFADEEFETGEE